MISIDEYFTKINSLRGEELSAEDEEKIGTAFNLAKTYHKGQKRANGEDYFDAHCIPVSYHVAELGMDSDMIAAALLHDSIEDTKLTIDNLVAHCGADVAEMVDGVSKLSKIKYKGNDRHIESLRKFFVAIAKDVRVVILKLCDRWHNLETLQYLPKEKSQRIAKESILIHAQLASRLGMGQLSVTLKDLAFPYAYPDEYKKTVNTLKTAHAKADDVIESFYRHLHETCFEALGYEASIDKRVKSVFSSYQKLIRKDWNISELYDLVALRVIVKDIPDCYKALGAIHARWQPLPGRVKDYIAIPKPNGYKSLHTVLISGSGLMIEVQIRTQDMHQYNEFGIASHHGYKNRMNGEARESFDWIEQLSKLKDEDLSPEEYINYLNSDFFETRIFALTPMGDVIDLPAGASVLDFAYAVHSDIGDHAIGARVNGQYRALDTTVTSESVIEIVTSPKTKPSKKWLDFVVTSHARTKISKYLNRNSTVQSGQ